MKKLATLFPALLLVPFAHALKVGMTHPVSLQRQTKERSGPPAIFSIKACNRLLHPAAMTPGCTKQACSYRDGAGKLSKLDAVVVGVSGDNVQSLKYFKTAENLNFTLFQTSRRSREAFESRLAGGKIQRTVEGKEVTLSRANTASRWTFVINKKGKIIYKNSR